MLRFPAMAAPGSALVVGPAPGDVPLAGFFGNGEFAPVGRRNFFHNYTGALVVFPDA